MDMIFARSLFTVLVAVAFALIVIIAFSKRNQGNYKEAARSIIDDEDTPIQAVSMQAALQKSDRENGAK